ncbi:hypothetical protein BJ742DRAFT_458877 [Cladochytrium replicatum]|nr:hypothetical protein BJ742DRAFT_458877 [Cladochytrium replicatum]
MEKNGEDMGPIMGIGRQTRRLYDRHSAPQPDEKYHGYAPAYHPVPEGGYDSEEYYPMPGTKSNRNSVHSPLIRPKTPADDAIGSANWSVTGVPSLNLPVAGAPGMPNMTSPRLPVHEDLSVPDNMGLRVGNYARRPGSVSPIIVTPSTPMTPGGGPLSPSVHAAAAAAAAAIQHAHNYGNSSFQQHPASGWGHVRLAPGAGGGLAPGALSPGGGLRSPGSHSDFSDYDENYADTSSAGTGVPGRPRNGPSQGGAHKEKGKIPEAIDLEALKGLLLSGAFFG